MKIYSCPIEFKFSYSNYTHQAYNDAVKEHCKQVEEKMREMGYNGKHTGKVFMTPFADGYASYMIADAPRNFCLVHLPHGDAWHSREAPYLTKKAILERSVTSEKYCG